MGTPVPSIEDGDALPHGHRQFELHGPLHVFLLASSDIFSDGLGGSLGRFGGDRESGQQVHLLATMIEGGFMAHHR